MTGKILAKLLEEATEVREERSEDRFGQFKGCVDDRMEEVRKGIRPFWGGIDRRIDGRKHTL
jgi:hypothetical protein